MSGIAVVAVVIDFPLKASVSCSIPCKDVEVLCVVKLTQRDVCSSV